MSEGRIAKEIPVVVELPRAVRYRMAATFHSRGKGI